MRAGIITVLVACTYLQTMAQEKDKSMQSFGKAVTDKFPTTRIFDVQYEQLTPTNFDSELFGKDFERGRIDQHNRLKVAFNMPFYVSDSKRFILTASLRYKYETYGFDEINNAITSTAYTRETHDFHLFTTAISATYVSSLFKKRVIYNATVSVDGNQENVQRVKGFATATLVLKKTANTTITIGAMAILDPSSIIPLTPLFTYNHKFENSKWDIDFILPQRLLFRREILENGRISVGTELNSESFYLHLNGENLKGIYEMNQLELKSGLTYEYRITPKVITFFKGGVNNVLFSRITERGQRTNRYVYDHKEETQGYFRVGISYNPF